MATGQSPLKAPSSEQRAAYIWFVVRVYGVVLSIDYLLHVT